MTVTSLYRNIVLLVFIILLGSFLIYLAVKSNSHKNNTRNNCNNSNSNSNKSILYERFTETGKLEKPTNVKVKVNLDTSSIILSFKYNKNTSGYTPEKYLVVLAKYLDDVETGERKRIGDSQFSISDESSASINNKMCTKIGNIITCEHTFANINSRDNQGNPYLFKVGVAAILGDNISDFATPSNIGMGNEFFKMVNDINENVNNSVMDSSTVKEVSDYGSYGATGSYIDMLKSQLGGYPNNLVMDKNISDANTLSDLIDNTFAHGTININVSS